MDRAILHCDLNAFFASVEEVRNPELRPYPMAVGGNPERRHGIILAKSENVSKYIFFSGDWEVLEEMQEHYRKNGKPEGLRFGANIRFINEKTIDFVKRSDLWEVGLNNEAFTKEDVEMFESMGIKVFSNLGDYPEWWQQICDMGIAGFKTNYPDAYTEWWLSTH